MPGLVIKPRSRIFHGHDWVYASDVLKAWGDPADGEVVTLKDGKDRLLGSAIYNSTSQIVARRISRQRQELDRDFFERRIRQAAEYRARRNIDPLLCRLVWSESDGLPGLTVDRYGECLVMQTLTLAMDRRKPMILEALFSVFGERPVIERNDAPIRRAEGLDSVVGILAGSPPTSMTVNAGGIEFEIDLLHGHKTGFYLDQVGNYAEVASWAPGRRVLDCFANQGAFSLFCARAGAQSVDAVEISAACVEQMRANAARNSLSIQTHATNVFDHLKDLERRNAQYDLIILDPPSFTKSKERLQDAMRGYKEIHLRALKLLAPAGLLATFSCSHHVTGELFKGMIVDALVDAKKSARQLRVFHQSADHPILTTIPETEYLKGYLLELAPGR